MPAELFPRTVNLDLFYPRFLEKLLRVKAACKARGALYLTTEGYRSMDRSAELFKAYQEGGNRAAPPGSSGHNFGISSDEALIIQPSPNRVIRWNKEDFAVLREELAKEGLLSGAVYGDYPHVDFPGFVTGKELAPLRQIWDRHKNLDTLPRLKKVWQYLDQHQP